MTGQPKPPARRRFRSGLAKLGLLLASSLLGLLLVELGLRLVGYEGDAERRETVIDSRFGTVRKNSWIFDFEFDPSARTTRVGRLSYPTRKRPGSLRTLFVGDSGTFGAFVKPHLTFPARYERILDEEHPGRPVEALNAGVWGMTNVDELFLLREKLLPLEPDVVILGLFMSNDINFNLGHRDLVSRSGPGLSAKLRQHSALGHFLWLRTAAVNARFKFFQVDSGVDMIFENRRLTLIDSNGFHMLNYPVGETATYMKTQSDLIDHAYRVLDDVFAEFQALGVEHGFEFRVVLVPSPSTIMGELSLLYFQPDSFAPLVEQGLEVHPEQLDFDLPTRRALEICRQRGIVCIDPTDRLRPLGLKAFQDGDEHLSIEGHEVVARVLAESYRPEP